MFTGNGVCKCGDCDCNDGFIGEACECPTSEESCRATGGAVSDQICVTSHENQPGGFYSIGEDQDQPVHQIRIFPYLPSMFNPFPLAVSFRHI